MSSNIEVVASASSDILTQSAMSSTSGDPSNSPVESPSVLKKEITTTENAKETESSEGITKPGPHDVLLGRGGGTNNHIGNIQFRKLINEHKIRYFACSKVEKPQVAREVVQLWRKMTPPGRFLARLDEGKEKEKEKGGKGSGNKSSKTTNKGNTDSSPEESSENNDSAPCVWIEVGDKRAREKASQCLRERTPEVMPYLKQIREQQDAMTEQGVTMFQQRMERQQLQHQQQLPNGHGNAAGPVEGPPPPQGPYSSVAANPFHSAAPPFAAQSSFPTDPTVMHSHPRHAHSQHVSPSQLARHQQQRMVTMPPGRVMPGPPDLTDFPHNTGLDASQRSAGYPRRTSCPPIPHPMTAAGYNNSGNPLTKSHSQQPPQPPRRTSVPSLNDPLSLSDHHPPFYPSEMTMMGNNNPTMYPPNMTQRATTMNQEMEYQQRMMMMQRQMHQQQMQIQRLQEQQMRTGTGNVNPAGTNSVGLGSGSGHGRACAPSAGANGLSTFHHAGSSSMAPPPEKDEFTPLPVQEDILYKMEKKEPPATDRTATASKVAAHRQSSKMRPKRTRSTRSSDGGMPRVDTAALKAAEERRRARSIAVPDAAPSSTEAAATSSSTAESTDDALSNPVDILNNPEGELTIEQYRRQLEEYMNNNQLLDNHEPGDDLEDDDDDSDLEDDWEREKGQAYRQQQQKGNKAGDRGVNRTISGCSFMSTDTFKSTGLFSDMSLLSGELADNNNASRDDKKALNRSISSNLSLMSELTNLSDTMDELRL